MFKIVILLIIFGTIALIGSYIWETLHSPIYTCIYRQNGQRYCRYIWPATFGDVLFLYLIYIGGGIIWKDWYWFTNLNLWKCVFIAVLGTVLAVFLEWRGVYKQKRWNYSDKMPKIFGIGLSPLVQLWGSFIIVSGVTKLINNLIVK